ncbi:MAG: helix-turn-helix domain-containing protein [Clostridiales bacterium]
MGKSIKKTTYYKLSEFANLVNVSISTLQRWDREKILIAYRTPTNRRYYTDDHLKKFTTKGVC